MKKLDWWESGREEIRKMPIVCPNVECGKQIQVSAFIKDDELVIENCPSCDAPISGALYVGEPDVQEEIQYPISAEIKWQVEGSVIGERTTKFGPVPDIGSMLLYVLRDGVNFFGSPGLSSQQLYATIADFIIRNLLHPGQLREIMTLCGERLMNAADLEQFTVIKSNGGNGEEKPSCDKDKTEEESDDDE